MRIQSLLSGAISCLPGGNTYLFRRHKALKTNATTSNARYCYSVWLRHLVLANKYGLTTGVPSTIAELGPGNSLGTGLAALISGAKKYYAFDVVHHMKNTENINTFDALIKLFEMKADIPNEEEFPKIKTTLDNYSFPSDILNDHALKLALNKERIAKLRKELLQETPSKSSSILYIAPWNDEGIISKGTIDMIFSMSVLEHVDDLQSTYHATHSWLKDNGFMSHEIDFKCHGHSNKWNGHWAYSDFIWRIIRGCRPYLINRLPHSTHVAMLLNNNFEIVVDLPKHDYSGIKQHELTRKFKNFSEQDVNTHNTFIISRKKTISSEQNINPDFKVHN